MMDIADLQRRGAPDVLIQRAARRAGLVADYTEQYPADVGDALSWCERTMTDPADCVWGADYMLYRSGVDWSHLHGAHVTEYTQWEPGMSCLLLAALMSQSLGHACGRVDLLRTGFDPTVEQFARAQKEAYDAYNILGADDLGIVSWPIVDGAVVHTTCTLGTSLRATPERIEVSIYAEGVNHPAATLLIGRGGSVEWSLHCQRCMDRREYARGCALGAIALLEWLLPESVLSDVVARRGLVGALAKIDRDEDMALAWGSG